MPNYGLVINSTYNPMSFADYAAPFEKYASVYKEMADTYDALEMEANQWEKLANSTQDAAQYQQYKKYAEDLRIAANDLAENGLNTKTRGSISNLKRRYASEIKPIADAWDLREKERELQRQAQLQNPDIMFDRNAATTGLSAYMSGTPALKNYDGKRLYEYVSSAVSNLAKAAREDLIANGVKSDWYQILGGQYYQKDNYQGVTPDVIMQSMFDSSGNVNPVANQYLKTIAEGALAQSGMTSWSNWQEIANRAYNYINQGLWGAIGTSNEKQLSNKYYDYLLAQKSKPTESPTGPFPINPRNIYSRKKQGDAKKVYNVAKQYIIVDNEGNWEIGNPHIQKHPTNRESYSTYLTTEGGYELVKIFKQEWKKHTGKDLTDTEANQYMLNPQNKKTVGKLIKKYFDEVGLVNENYDATRYTEYNYAYNSEEQKDIKNAILPLLQNVDLEAVDWDDENSTYKVTGDVLTAKELQEANILESNFSYINGKVYTVISVQHKDGSIGTYKMPVGINRQNEEVRNNSLMFADNIRVELNKINNDRNTIDPQTGQPYTDSKIAYLNALYKNHLQNAYKAQSQIGLKYKTQDVTMQGYGY